MFHRQSASVRGIRVPRERNRELDYTAPAGTEGRFYLHNRTIQPFHANPQRWFTTVANTARLCGRRASEDEVAARLESLITAVKRRVFAKRGEPYRIAGHMLRYVVGTKPVSLRHIKSRAVVQLHDALQIKLLSELLRDGDRTIDVGARAGSHALIMAALCGHAGEVIAFEPNPVARELLLRNIKLNGAIKPPIVELAAVSDRSGAAVLYSRSGVDDNASMAVLGLEGATPSAITTVSLDDYLASHPENRPVSSRSTPRAQKYEFYKVHALCSRARQPSSARYIPMHGRTLAIVLTICEAWQRKPDVAFAIFMRLANSATAYSMA